MKYDRWKGKGDPLCTVIRPFVCSWLTSNSGVIYLFFGFHFFCFCFLIFPGPQWFRVGFFDFGRLAKTKTKGKCSARFGRCGRRPIYFSKRRQSRKCGGVLSFLDTHARTHCAESFLLPGPNSFSFPRNLVFFSFQMFVGGVGTGCVDSRNSCLSHELTYYLIGK